MYITDFVCTYKNVEDEYTDDIYRSQLLQAFNLEEYDYKKIEENMNDLFFYFKNDSNGLKILEVLLIKQDKFPVLEYFISFNDKKSNLEKMEEIFFLLFSYDLFDNMHLCLIDLFNKGQISNEKKDLFIKQYLNKKLN